MTQLPIGQIISDSFRLAWRHKYLWLFGLFATSGAGGPQLHFGQQDIEQTKAWILAALAMLVLIGLAVGLVILILHVITKSALIYNVYQIETGGAHSLSGGWDFGVKRFWPMLGVTLLELMAFVVLIGGLVAVEVIIFIASVILGFLSLLVAIPVAIFLIATLVLIWEYAERFVTLETRGVFEAIGAGWDLLVEQWKPSALMLLAKFFIAIAIGAAAAIVGVVLLAPAIALWVVSKPAAVVYGILVLLPLYVVVNAYVGSFDSAAWTKAFLHLRAPAYATAHQGAAPPPTGPAGAGSQQAPPLFE